VHVEPQQLRLLGEDLEGEIHGPCVELRCHVTIKIVLRT